MRSTMQQIPLVERTEGDNYLSSNKSVSGVRLNHYKLSDDGRHLEIDLSITLYRETKGDIRVLYKGGQGENPVFRITKKYVPLNR